MEHKAARQQILLGLGLMLQLCLGLGKFSITSAIFPFLLVMRLKVVQKLPSTKHKGGFSQERLMEERDREPPDPHAENHHSQFISVAVYT